MKETIGSFNSEGSKLRLPKFTPLAADHQSGYILEQLFLAPELLSGITLGSDHWYTAPCLGL